jgi:hypothetical protein
MKRLANDAELRSSLGANAHRRFREFGAPRIVAGDLLDSLGRAGISF